MAAINRKSGQVGLAPMLTAVAFAASVWILAVLVGSAARSILAIDTFALARAQLYGNTKSCRPSKFWRWEPYYKPRFVCLGTGYIKAHFDSFAGDNKFSSDVTVDLRGKSL